MNFGYKKTVEKRKELSSNSRRIKSKAIMTFVKILLYALVLVIMVGGFTVFGMIKGILNAAPAIEDVNVSPSASATLVYDSTGVQVTTISTDGSNRTEITIDQIPESLQYAFIDIEDERFYDHSGIDLQGILRAAFVTLSGSGFEGGSTITQQLIKNNVFESGGFETNLGALFKRKIQEQYLAIEIEKILDKDVILENYLNTINLGAGNYGVSTAASYYFGKDVSELTISESAVIAAIAQNPSNNPVTYPEKNAARRSKVLTNMLKNNHITQKEYDEAVEDDIYSRIQANTSGKSNTPVYSYFTDALIDQVLADLEEQGYSANQASNALYRGGLQIYSTQDTAAQAICDEELANDENYPSFIYYSFDWAWTIELPDGTQKNYAKGNIYNYHRKDLGESDFTLNFRSHEDAIACVEEFKAYILTTTGGEEILEQDISFTIQPQVSFSIMDQFTGEVKALVGGRGEKTGSLTLNRATVTARQPGSTFKTLAAYAPAMDSAGYTLATVLDDSPYAYGGGTTYVKNWYGENYRGLNTVRTGLIQSMNILAVRTLSDIGADLAIDYLLKFGFTTIDPIDDANAATALGGVTTGVKNLELCAAYATIANKGTYTEPILYTKILDKNGRVILENEPNTEVVLKESTAWLLNSALEDVVKRGTGGNASIPGINVAGKTGTTSKSYDLWFVGYSGYLTACIWTGYDENMTLDAASYHSVLWSKIMTRVHSTNGWTNKAIMSMPGDIVQAQVCSKSGKLPVAGFCDLDPAGSAIITEYFAQGTVPTESCDAHIGLTVCTESNQLASLNCPTTKIQVFRVRPEGSEGVTMDSPYTIPVGFLDTVCKLHINKPEETTTKKPEETTTEKP